MKKLEIGQKLYYEETENRDRPTGEAKELTVSKIGNKYFYCNDIYGRVNTDYNYDLRTLKHSNKNYNSCDRQLYTSLEAIEEKVERLRLLNEVQKFFKDYTKPNKLDVTQLTKIWDIIEEVKERNLKYDILT